ncbi:hypothetical protein GCM10017673_52660 [Streptosporangium violaceochromogenes]|nr:hypothetical protein GCM10017673_52660 [Streptosporangium violaceochromogenes]
MDVPRRSDPPLLVPVRPGAGTLALRLFRTPAGRRTAVAFTSRDRLAQVLGDGHAWTWLSEPALRGMIEGLDVAGIVVDPTTVARRRNPRLRVA